MKITELPKKAKRVTFENSLEFAEYADWDPNQRGKTKDNDPDYIEWAGGTFGDAMRQVREGNPMFVKNLFDGVNVLTAMIQEEKISEIRDVTGEYFDVGDFLSGEPEVFRRDEYGLQKPVIPLIANFGMLADIDPEIIINRGCAIVALVDELQRSGFIVDLRVVKASEDSWGDCNTVYGEVKVKTDPVDLDAFAFLIANPLCLRMIWFGCLEHLFEKKNLSGSYGSSVEFVVDDIFEKGVSGFYFVSSSHRVFNQSNYSSLENAKRHVLSMIDKFKTSAEQVILG